MCRGCYSCYVQRTRHFFCKAYLQNSTHNLHEQIVLFSNSFCVSCKSVPACFRSQPAQRWVKFTTKVRHFRRLNHDRSEYWPSLSPRLWTFPDYMVEPQSFPANTAKTWGQPEIFSINVWLCVSVSVWRIFFSFQNNPVIFHYYARAILAVLTYLAFFVRK